MSKWLVACLQNLTYGSLWPGSGELSMLRSVQDEFGLKMLGSTASHYMSRQGNPLSLSSRQVHIGEEQQWLGSDVEQQGQHELACQRNNQRRTTPNTHKGRGGFQIEPIAVSSSAALQYR